MEENKTKTLITIPFISRWYFVLTLIFILMQNTGIINWSPLWLLSPLWIPIIVILMLYIMIIIVKYIFLHLIK